MNKLTVIILAAVIIVGLGFVIVKINTRIGIEPIDFKPLPRVSYPQPNQVIKSPLEVVGEAPGNWFFEASLPVKLLDADGEQIAVVPAQAEGDWMTTDYVPFKTNLIFNPATSTTGTLIIANDNPSGLPANDRQIAIPIKFLP
jgi:hypothetical protein